jgi:NADPH-dependent F420 reductase
MNDKQLSKVVAILGGTGREGQGLAYRWSKAGYRVVIGSRAAEKAIAVAREVRQRLGNGGEVEGMSNLDAANEAAIVVLTVPYAAHRDILTGIRTAVQGKLLVDATVPIVAGAAGKAWRPPAGSAAEEARQILGDGTEVVAAFHSVSHQLLLQDGAIDCDVLVTGTSKQARNSALALVAAAGLRGWDAGALENSSVSEGLASVLIHINKQRGSKHAGLKITGAEQS